MLSKPSPDPKSSMWGWLAHDLRFHRNQRGLWGDAVAKLINCARSSLSRLENGEAKLDEGQAATLDERWQTGGHFGTILWYARLGHDPNWIKQHVVDWPMGGREVMRKPLVDLLEVSERPNIGIRVIPRSAGDVAYTESPGGRLVSSAREVQSHVARYDRIGQKALPEDLSRQLIARVMETMK